MSSIFRREALDYRSSRLSGEINLAQPFSWQFVSYFMAAVLVISVIILISSTYTKNETVTGTIVPSNGLVRVFPTRPGKVVELSVSEGASVRAGQMVARIQTAESLNDGSERSTKIYETLLKQDKGIIEQIIENRNVNIFEESRMSQQIVGLENEISILENQISIQERLIAQADKDLKRANEIAERGFVSQNEIARREEILLSRRQALEQYRQTKATKAATKEEALRSIERNRAQSSGAAAALGAERARLEQQSINAEVDAGYTLTAPVSGSATAISARLGQQVDVGGPVLAIIPSGSHSRAELHVRSRAIGFVSPGQQVRLTVDSFPYQQFGSLTGRVLSVPTAPTLLRDENGGIVQVYTVIVELDRQGFVAFGKRHRLLSGMSITARITTRKQSLIEWLFEPLFALKRR